MHAKHFSTSLAYRMADHYDAQPAYCHTYRTELSYRKMMLELGRQYRFCQRTLCISFEPWCQSGQPYSDSHEMREDVRLNKHLWYFKTEDGFGDEDIPDHPLLTPYGHDPSVCYNDLLRSVHDVLGHVAADSGFGPRGEERAWLEHRKWFSPAALPAITNETRMQNSWVNFGPHSHLAPKDRPYAKQKVGLAPEWACTVTE